VKAIQVTEPAGPGSVRLVDLPAPEADAVSAPGSGVLVDVRACGVAFPDVLMTRGAYQHKPELPFTPGIEVAGTVVAAAPDASFASGERVVAVLPFGGMAERVVTPQVTTQKLPDELDFVAGAGLAVNYQTAYFSLVTRGRLQRGDTVLVHGAAGGVGTASVQVAGGLGARTIAVVSTDEKARVAREAGAHEVVRVEDWIDAVRALAPDGVQMVIDPVGGERLGQSLGLLAPDGRLVIVGFAGGEIPEIKSNRVLFRNVDVVGAALGGYIAVRPDTAREMGERVNELVRGGVIRPLVETQLPLERAAEALTLLEERAALGQVVLTMTDPSDS
jgi:NADPH2:quinone reductase